MITCSAANCTGRATHQVTVATEPPRRFTAPDGEPGITEERRETFARCVAHIRMSSTRSVLRMTGVR